MTGPAPDDDLPTGVDPRAARFAGGLLSVTLLAGFVFGATWVIPLWLIARAIAAAVPPNLDPISSLFHLVVQPRLSPPAHWEDPAPFRAAALVDTGLLGLATLLVWLGASPLSWVLSLAVAVGGALLAVTDLCVGCELAERWAGRRERY